MASCGSSRQSSPPAKDSVLAPGSAGGFRRKNNEMNFHTAVVLLGLCTVLPATPRLSTHEPPVQSVDRSRGASAVDPQAELPGPERPVNDPMALPRPIPATVVPGPEDDVVYWTDPTTGTSVIVGDRQHVPHLDIEPGKCPNKIHVNGDDDDEDDDDGDDDDSYGQASAMCVATIRLGLLGNAFDVTQVDLGTIRLSQTGLQLATTTVIFPISATFEDVGTPFDGQPCECAALGPDGVLDIKLLFDRQELIDAFGLEAVPDGTLVQLRLSGRSLGGLGFRVNDCILVVNDEDGHGDGDGDDDDDD